MDEKIKVVEELRDGIKILRLQNVIMLSPDMAREMTDLLVAKFESGDQKVLLNLATVARMSSLFFRSFIIAGKKARERKALMAFCSITPTLKDGFEMMGLDSYFAFYPEETVAIDHLK